MKNRCLTSGICITNFARNNLSLTEKQKPNQMQKYVVIVAGGSGSRMKADKPKQFLLLSGQPILMHTIEAFYYSLNKELRIIIVLPKGQHQEWKDLCARHHFSIPHQITEGGQERFHSVKNGLKLVDDGIVAIHDGVRPAVSALVIDNAFKAAAEKGAAIPLIPVTDSLRQQSGENYNAVNRNSFFLVQTPQVFLTAGIKKAYAVPFKKVFTDDASVWEHAGHQVHFISGNKENIKITEPADLAYMEWLKTKKP